MEKVIYGEDFIQIKNAKGKELVYWIIDEWEAEPQVVFSICHAIQLATENKLEEFFKQKGIAR